MNVNAIAPPITTLSAFLASAETTPNLSLTFTPPRTATNGFFGLVSRPPRTSTSLARSRPAALGIPAGGPTIEAWARWAAPKASLT